MISSVDIAARHLLQQILRLGEERLRDCAASASDWC